MEEINIGVARRMGELKPLQPRKQDRQGDLQFEPGKRRADAEMDARSKGKLRPWRSMRVEERGVWPCLLYTSPSPRDS